MSQLPTRPSVARQPVFVFNDPNPVRPIGCPIPESRIDIRQAGTLCEPGNQYTRVPHRDQSLGNHPGPRFRPRVDSSFHGHARSVKAITCAVSIDASVRSVQRAVRRQVHRNVTPLATATQDIHDTVHDLPHRDFTLAPLTFAGSTHARSATIPRLSGRFSNGFCCGRISGGFRNAAWRISRTGNIHRSRLFGAQQTPIAHGVFGRTLKVLIDNGMAFVDPLKNCQGTHAPVPGATRPRTCPHANCRSGNGSRDCSYPAECPFGQSPCPGCQRTSPARSVLAARC